MATNGTESAPNTAFSFSSRLISTSPICACPVCTARLISGALNNAPPGCTVMASLPPVALAMSAANWFRFCVCGLPAG